MFLEQQIRATNFEFLFLIFTQDVEEAGVDDNTTLLTNANLSDED